MFVILKFFPSEEDSQEYIEVGLRKWIIGEPDDNMKCSTFWPPNNAERSIKLQHSLSDDWSVHPVQVLRFYDTYVRARAAVPKFCEDSHYETEAPDDLGKFKRKKYKRVIESSDEEVPLKISKKSIPAPPPISQTSSSQSRSQSAASQAAASVSNRSKKAPVKKHSSSRSGNKSGQNDSQDQKVDEARAAAQLKMNLNVAGSSKMGGIMLPKSPTPTKQSTPEKSILKNSNEAKTSRPRLEAITNKLKNQINERLKAARAAVDTNMNSSPIISASFSTPPRRVTERSLADNAVSSPDQSPQPLVTRHTPAHGSTPPVQSKPLVTRHSPNSLISSPVHSQTLKRVSQHVLNEDESLQDFLADDPEEVAISDSEAKTITSHSQTLKRVSQHVLNEDESLQDFLADDPEEIAISDSEAKTITSRSVPDVNPNQERKKSRGKTSSSDTAALERKVDLLTKMVNNNNVSIIKLHSKMDTLLVNNGKLLRKLVPHEKLKPPSNMPSLPVKTYGEFKILEDFLSNGAHEIAAVDYFSNYIVKGVDDAEKRSVRQILQNMFENSVAELFNLDGGNNKKAFRQTNSYKVFQASLISAFKEGNLLRFDTIAQSWLKDASWRKGGSNTKTSKC